MSIQVVDRRGNDKGKSSENRQRLLKRIDSQIKRVLPDIIKQTSVKDILTSGNKQVKIPIKGISEPQFHYNHQSGNKKYVKPGNKQFSQGDKIDKPQSGNGQGNGQQGSNDPSSSEDEFTISISRDEFLDYFFDELELPDLVKKHLNTIIDFKQKRAGFSSHGNPSRLNIVRSYKNALSRKMATEIFFEKEIKRIEERLKNPLLSIEERDKLLKELDKFQKMKLTVSFMEETDLQYNNFSKYPIPITSAVMFCIMDVSGSMGEKEKELSRRFFMLLYIFLTKQYEHIDLVFIRHHTDAKEVSEEEFFNSKESGGTIVFPALDLMNNIIKEKYNSNWNIYAAQASDGDVWDKSDANECGSILEKDILNKLQYMVYIEVLRNKQSDLWETYEKLKKTKENFEIGRINEVGDIWKVFQDFFKKKTV